MSNLGLTYRNSKWTNYSLSNVNDRSKNVFASLLGQVIAVFVFLLVVLCYQKNYWELIVVNDISYFLWCVEDDVFHVLTTSFWIGTQWLTLVVKKANSSLFLDDDEDQPVGGFRFYKWWTAGDQIQLPSILPTQTRTNRRQLVRTWLKLVNNKDETGQYLAKALFSNLDSSSNTNWLHYTRALYRTQFFFLQPNQAAADKPIYRFMQVEGTPAYITLPMGSSDVSWPSEFTKARVLAKFKNKTVAASTVKVSDSDRYLVRNISQEVDNSAGRIVGKKGAFYLTGKLNLELTQEVPGSAYIHSLTTAIRRQSQAVKWNRWLYRYNILHNRSLKNSHKLTSTKRLMNSGFYTSDLTTNNIWAANSLFTRPILDKKTKKVTPSQTKVDLQSMYKSMYGSWLTMDQQKPTWTSMSNSGVRQWGFDPMSFHEVSFFWFLKRNYLTSTLGYNHVASLPKVRSLNPTTLDLANQQTDSMVRYSSVMDIAAHLESINCATFDIYTKDLNTVTTYPLTNGSISRKTKDTLVESVELDVLTIDDLDILLDISNQDVVKPGKYQLFLNNKPSFYISSGNYKQSPCKSPFAK